MILSAFFSPLFLFHLVDHNFQSSIKWRLFMKPQAWWQDWTASDWWIHWWSAVMILKFYLTLSQMHAIHSFVHVYIHVSFICRMYLKRKDYAIRRINDLVVNSAIIESGNHRVVWTDSLLQYSSTYSYYLQFSLETLPNKPWVRRFERALQITTQCRCKCISST